MIDIEHDLSDMRYKSAQVYSEMNMTYLTHQGHQGHSRGSHPTINFRICLMNAKQRQKGHGGLSTSNNRDPTGTPQSRLNTKSSGDLKRNKKNNLVIRNTKKITISVRFRHDQIQLSSISKIKHTVLFAPFQLRL